jgi:hypothetical protein
MNALKQQIDLPGNPPALSEECQSLTIPGIASVSVSSVPSWWETKGTESEFREGKCSRFEPMNGRAAASPSPPQTCGGEGWGEEDPCSSGGS